MIGIEMREGKTSTPVNARSDARTGEELAKASSNYLQEVARKVLAEEQAKGFTKKPINRVDNKFGKDPKQVKPYGKIEFLSPAILEELVPDIYKKLLALSTIGDTHGYVQSHVILFNKKVVARNLATAIAWSKEAVAEKGDTLYFTNVIAYSRALELNASRTLLSGKGKGTTNTSRKHGFNGKQIVRKPNGAYTMAHMYATRKYSAAGFIRYRSLVPSEIGLSGSDLKGRSTFAETGRPYSYPTIMINFLGSA